MDLRTEAKQKIKELEEKDLKSIWKMILEKECTDRYPRLSAIGKQNLKQAMRYYRNCKYTATKEKTHVIENIAHTDAATKKLRKDIQTLGKWCRRLRKNKEKEILYQEVEELEHLIELLKNR
ncbi:35303_t:CDS:2 [Gigaspora margarita]|uniref:35303_t:CDS:1 n=1 Tax=Gigaspora margarita TaxID=4874 RepID=A0ABN7VK14_GIGMA|nr:35303_t:CDS:2 [Gigaspora margarita]